MKKLLILILAIGLIVAGCENSNSNINNSTKNNNVKSSNLSQQTSSNLNNNIAASENIESKNNLNESASNKNSSSNTESKKNEFFFNNKEQYVKYNGNFLFGDVIQKDTKLNINKLSNLKYGELYELKIDSIDNVPDNRLNLGYFYVQEDKIYKINPTKENFYKLTKNEQIPNDSVIVCQDKEIKDNLKENEKGVHKYIIANEDKREYHFFDNQTSTGYYETFIWEKSKGLIDYKSGYGADRDLIELQLK